MFLIMHVNKIYLHSLWIGLMKKDASFGPCTDSGCDGLLQWTDGSDFQFAAAVQGAVESSAANSFNCFKYTTDKLEPKGCLSTGEFVCQSLDGSYPCVASSYQYDGIVGKYFKVNSLVNQ